MQPLQMDDMINHYNQKFVCDFIRRETFCRRITLARLAKRAKLCRITLHLILNGKSSPTLKTVFKLMKALNDMAREC